MIGTPQEVSMWLWEQAPDAIVEAKVRRKRRSLTQNGYYWAMLNKLASELRMSDDEVHRWMLRDYGACEVFTVLAEVPLDGYFRYWDEVGTGTLNGREYRHIRAYKGSSEMDSAEFTRLIDGMRQECEAVGIPFMTPEEVARLDFVGGAQ